MPNWLQIAKKLNNNSIEEFALDFCKNVMGKKSFLGKRTMGVFEKSDLTDLPTIFAERIKGLKHPKVKIKNNCSQDYNCFAFSISESGKPVEQFVMSLDTATGAPVLNVSRKAFQEGEIAFSGRYLADTSKTVARGSKPTYSMAQDNVSLSISDADYAHWLNIKCNKTLAEQLTSRSGITIPSEKQILRIHKNAQSPKKVNEEMSKIRETVEPRVNSLKEKMQREIENTYEKIALKYEHEIKELNNAALLLRDIEPHFKNSKEQLNIWKNYLRTQEKNLKTELKPLESFGVSINIHKTDEGKLNDVLEQLYKEGKISIEEVYSYNHRIQMRYMDYLHAQDMYSRALKDFEEYNVSIKRCKTILKKYPDIRKSLQTERMEARKRIQTKYEAEIGRYYPQKQNPVKQAELKADKMEELLSGKNITYKSLKDYLKKENIQAYENKNIINQIRSLNGTTIECAEESKNIFLNELGFSPELIEVKQLNALEQGFSANAFGFDIVTGKIYISPEYNSSNLNTASIIRHELDHFQLFANLCKTMGLENFKNMVLRKNPKATAEMFNTEFWNKAMVNAKKLSPTETKKYINAYKNYNSISTLDFDLLSMIKYYGNPIETRAYDIQAAIMKSLKLESDDITGHIYMSRISNRIASALEELKVNKNMIIDNNSFQRMLHEEMSKVQSNEIDFYVVLNNLLNRLKTI